ncbi:MAG: isochorismatase family protein [Betaproteobacteria bacterium]|nr:isochorismatase family protein [Betaproteobacteria bacterium]
MAILSNNPIGLGRRPALLVIDATFGFADPSSPVGTDGAAPIAMIARLLAAFRALKLAVVFTSNAYASPDEAPVFREKLPGLNELVAGGRWAEIDPRVAPTTDDLVLRKTVPSAFSPAARRVVKRAGVDSVVVCGFSTSGRVLASTVDALQHNLRVVVAADACGDRDIEAHLYNLRDLGLKTGDVVSTQQALALLDRVGATAID